MLGRPIALPPGRAAQATVRWNGRRCAGSAPTDCPDDPTPPGTYRIAVRWLAAGTGALLIIP
jgi:hypothetical protein